MKVLRVSPTMDYYAKGLDDHRHPYRTRSALHPTLKLRKHHRTAFRHTSQVDAKGTTASQLRTVQYTTSCHDTSSTEKGTRVPGKQRLSIDSTEQHTNLGTYHAIWFVWPNAQSRPWPLWRSVMYWWAPFVVPWTTCRPSAAASET